MFYIIISILIISITQGFILLEEELLIILASIVWVDAAGKIIKDLLESEVENKSKVIKDKYLWFLVKKKESYNNLLELYSKRFIFLKKIENLELDVILLLIRNNLLYFFNNLLIVQCYNIVILLINIGFLIVKEIFSKEIIILIKILQENSIYLKKYTIVNYIINPIGNLSSMNIIPNSYQ